MRKLVLLAHISLDGFVAGPGGELSGFDAADENLAFVAGLTETADTALFGRVSYEMLNSYWPTAKDLPNATAAEIKYAVWYNKAQKIVLSTTLPDTGAPELTIIRNDVLHAIRKYKEQPGRGILLFGSPRVSQLLVQTGLIDSFWIFVNPVLFGKGIPLFTGNHPHVKLVLTHTQTFPNGETALQYVVKKS